MTSEIRRTLYRVRLELDGLVAVHAARSVWTALAAVAGIVSAEVNMSGALLEMDRPPDRRALDDALEPAGVRILAMTVEQGRMLPLA